jgi:hypothetical protein
MTLAEERLKAAVAALMIQAGAHPKAIQAHGTREHHDHAGRVRPPIPIARPGSADRLDAIRPTSSREPCRHPRPWPSFTDDSPIRLPLADGPLTLFLYADIRRTEGSRGKRSSGTVRPSAFTWKPRLHGGSPSRVSRHRRRPPVRREYRCSRLLQPRRWTTLVHS